MTENDSKIIYGLIKEKKVTDIRRKMITEGTDPSALIQDLEELIMEDPDITIHQKGDLLLFLAETNRSLPFVVLPRLEIEWFVIKALRVI